MAYYTASIYAVFNWDPYYTPQYIFTATIFSYLETGNYKTFSY